MRTPESRGEGPPGENPPEITLADDGSQAALRAALARFRLGEDIHHAAEAEGVAAWRLLEEAQAMPDPGAIGPPGNDLEPFIRRR